MSTASVDLRGLRGPYGSIDWEIDPTRIRWPFDRPFENFRLLDPLSRVVAIAVEALDTRFPANTAVVLATKQGCLWTDRRFEQSRHADLRPALFPYTLPSAPIAAVSIRHGINGPSLCLSGDESALAEAERLIATGEADAAIVCVGDVVPPDLVQMTVRYLTR